MDWPLPTMQSQNLGDVGHGVPCEVPEDDHTRHLRCTVVMRVVLLGCASCSFGPFFVSGGGRFFRGVDSPGGAHAAKVGTTTALHMK